MRLTSQVLACVLLTAATGVYAVQPSSNYVGASQDFSLTQKTQIPGGTLTPGDYSIHVLDQLSDRMIVRIDSNKGTDHTIFLGVPHSGFDNAGAVGPVSWKSGLEGDPILRGFEFSSGGSIEFVYPKAEAAALAKLNAARVVALDPESEGRPALKKMSKDDMQVVTLWMLSLTTEAPNSKTPAIQAQRYVPDTSTAGTQVASRNGVQPVSAATASTQVASLPPAPPLSLVGAASPVKRQRAISQLPHTASPLPLLWLLGSVSLLLAFMFRLSSLFRPGQSKR